VHTSTSVTAKANIRVKYVLVQDAQAEGNANSLQARRRWRRLAGRSGRKLAARHPSSEVSYYSLEHVYYSLLSSFARLCLLDVN
jgi:hypothetical protein